MLGKVQFVHNPEFVGDRVDQVRTSEGDRVTHGMILTDKLRPARREATPIAVVEWCPEPFDGWLEGYWLPLKLD